MILAYSELNDFVSRNCVTRKNGVRPTVDLVSIGLHLGEQFLRYKPQPNPVDLPSSLQTETVPLQPDGHLHFPPGASLLAVTEERIEMPLDLMGFIQTKGTIARGFVIVHLCDGQIDPGFKGHITLELVNFSHIPYRLKPGTAVAQLFVHKITSPAPHGYNGRYQNPDGPTPMRA
jgi:dCTP deaminase